MKSFQSTFKLIIFLTLFSGIDHFAFSQSNIEEDDSMKQYFMVFLSKGPDRSQDSITAAKIQEGHLNNISRLMEEKKMILAGPFLDEGNVVGIFIFDVPTIEEATALANTDPAVKAGRLKATIRPWYGPGNILIQKAVKK